MTGRPKHQSSNAGEEFSGSSLTWPTGNMVSRPLQNHLPYSHQPAAQGLHWLTPKIYGYPHGPTPASVGPDVFTYTLDASQAGTVHAAGTVPLTDRGLIALGMVLATLVVIVSRICRCVEARGASPVMAPNARQVHLPSMPLTSRHEHRPRGALCQRLSRSTVMRKSDPVA